MKKRIVTLALVVALVATCFGGTYAYLKDTKAVKNTFTTGNVYIDLAETGTFNEFKLFPGDEITKDPTITLKAGSEAAYVAAKVTVSSNADLSQLIGITGTDMIDINVVAKGGLISGTPVAETWNGLAVHSVNGCHIYQKADKAAKAWTLYIFMDAQQTAGTVTTLFNKLTIPTTWDNAQMDMIEDLDIDVKAFAAQAHGFANCYDAMTKAFGTEFSF